VKLIQANYERFPQLHPDLLSVVDGRKKMSGFLKGWLTVNFLLVKIEDGYAGKRYRSCYD